ncbi:MAG: hypothetical protein OXD01_15475 [Gammaproteobacteria bacterium]|nr:hypothetical protein [Gammaproteobacteria bacterium]
MGPDQEREFDTKENIKSIESSEPNCFNKPQVALTEIIDDKGMELRQAKRLSP